MLLEGDYTNDPNLPAYFEGIVGVGDKSKNLFNGVIYKGIGLDSGNGTTGSNTARDTTDYIKVKPNTSYTISGCSTAGRVMYDSNKKYTARFDDVPTANKTLTFTTTSNTEYIKFAVINTEQYQIQLEEGSVATPCEPYYEGHKIEILSKGKNLIDVYNDNVKTYLASSHKITLNNSNGFDLVSLADNTGWIYSQIKFPITLKPNTRYRLSCIIEKSNPTSKPYIRLYDFDKPQSFGDLERTGSANFVTGTTNLDNYRLLLYSSIDDIPSKQNDKVSFKNICLEELGDFTYPYSYDSPKSNKTQILLDEPLMRLSNDVYDEITIDGKLIRRIGKVILNGTEY